MFFKARGGIYPIFPADPKDILSWLMGKAWSAGGASISTLGSLSLLFQSPRIEIIPLCNVDPPFYALIFVLRIVAEAMEHTRVVRSSLAHAIRAKYCACWGLLQIRKGTRRIRPCLYTPWVHMHRLTAGYNRWQALRARAPFQNPTFVSNSDMTKLTSIALIGCKVMYSTSDVPLSRPELIILYIKVNTAEGFSPKRPRFFK